MHITNENSHSSTTTQNKYRPFSHQSQKTLADLPSLPPPLPPKTKHDADQGAKRISSSVDSVESATISASMTSLLSSQRRSSDYSASQLRRLSASDEEQDKDVLQKPQPDSRFSLLGRYRCCLISSLIILVAIVIAAVVCYFQLPQIAQLVMNGANVSFQSIQMVSPRANGFTAYVSGRVSNAGPFSATTTPMLITISHEQTAIGQLEMPGLYLSFGQADFRLASNFTILDGEGFVRFAKALLRDETVGWRLEGRTSLDTMGLHISNLIFDKTVSLKGMNGFPSVSVDSFNLFADSNDERNGIIQLKISTLLQNASPFSVDIGDLKLDMEFDGRSIGYAYGTGVTLSSGTNSLPMTGALTKPNNSDSSHFSKMFSNYVSGVESIISVSGSQTFSPRGSPAWLVEITKALRLNIKFPPAKDTEFVKSVALSGMKLVMSENNPLEPVLSVDKINVGFRMPFDFPIHINEISQQIETIDLGHIIGRASTPFISASNALNASVISTSMPSTPLTIPAESMSHFSTFMTKMFVSNSSEMTMRGTATVKARSPVGDITLSGLTFTQSVQIEGMHRLLALPTIGTMSMNPLIHGVTVVKGYKDQIVMKSNLTLFSMASVGMTMGDVTLMIDYKGQNIGYSVLRNLTILPGDNNIICDTYFKPETPEAHVAGREMISNYVSGIASKVIMTGSMDKSTKIDVLKESVSYLRLESFLPPIREPIVKSASLAVNPFRIGYTKTAKSSFLATNPFLDNFTIVSMKANISLAGKELARMNASSAPLPVTIPALKSLQTPRLEVSMDNPFSYQSLSAFGSGLIRRLAVDVESEIVARIGEFETKVSYKQSQLPATISLI